MVQIIIHMPQVYGPLFVPAFDGVWPNPRIQSHRTHAARVEKRNQFFANHLPKTRGSLNVFKLRPNRARRRLLASIPFLHTRRQLFRCAMLFLVFVSAARLRIMQASKQACKHRCTPHAHRFTCPRRFFNGSSDAVHIVSAREL